METLTRSLLNFTKPHRPWLFGIGHFPTPVRQDGHPAARGSAGGARPCRVRAVGEASPLSAATFPATAAPATAEAAPGNQPAVVAAEQESLELLEWPALCRQVACFTQTAIGAETALTCRLPIGRTQDESERLLQETEEAQRVALTLKGVFDVRRALEAARAGLVLHPLVLGAVGLTLEAAQRLDAALHAPGGSYPALQQLAAGLQGGVPEVQQALFQCIQVDNGRILDAASERLATVRAKRRQNMQELRRRLDEWARLLHSKGVSERPQVVIRRDRLCIPVKAGRQGELPKGSLTLATSASGSTLYMEPEPVVALNNREMALAGEEQEEEERVLTALSRMVASHADAIDRILLAVTALDVATARGRHAAWLGATRPAFLSAEAARSAGLVCIPRAWHPLLLQPCLPPLPAPPVVDLPPSPASSRPGAAGSPQEAPPQELPGTAGLSLVPELLEAGPGGAAAPRVAGKQPGSAQGAGAGAQGGSGDGGSGGSDEASPRPMPVDLLVPPGVGVVAVTGPNTGGKTASLKALGLLSLMAKAGCFIPQAPLQQQQQQQEQQGEGGGNGAATGGAPRLLWFEKVLADLGDGQSLQQSLSTFSGHVRRIRNILAAVTPRSLVLLDEVGSGTDPTEGAALASALLERLRSSAALTYATTHHAELKELALSAPGFVNASVEFDVATLRPTYRILWGRAGESNALAVAEGLGFSAAVVAQARQVATQLHAVRDASQRAKLLQRSLEEELAEALEAAEAASAHRHAAEAELAAASQQVEALEQEAQAAGKSSGGEAKAQVQKAKEELARALAGARSGALSIAEAEAVVRRVEQQAAAANQAALSLVGLRLAAEAGIDYGEGSTPASGPPKSWVPRQGERVRVLKMGGAPGTVVAAPQGSSRKVSVRVGAQGLTMEMKVSDLAPAAPPAGEPRKGVAKRAGQAAGAAGRSGREQAAQAKEKLRAEGVLVVDSRQQQQQQQQQGVAVAIQTSRNTVDVRGKLADDAASEVERAVSLAPPGSALFVVHGVGTGRVRAAVREALKRSKLVQRFEEQPESLGGCTIAITRQ